MSAENETLADIAEEMRALVAQGETLNNTYELLHVIADRIEAAARREMSKIASKDGADFGQFGNVAKLREAASNALAELKLFRKIHDARLHFCDIVHVGNAKSYLHAALALFTDSPENENSGADNVTAGKQEMPGNEAKA